jgi:hypothetical protein
MVLAVNLNPRAQPRLKPERVERGSFRSAEALLPRMNAGAPTDRQTQIPHLVRDGNCDARCSGHIRKKTGCNPPYCARPTPGEPHPSKAKGRGTRATTRPSKSVFDEIPERNSGHLRKKIVCATCSMPVPFRVTSRQRHTASTGFQFRPSTIHNSSDFGAMICAGMLGITGTAWLEIRPRGVKRSRIGAVPELRKFGNSPV